MPGLRVYGARYGGERPPIIRKRNHYSFAVHRARHFGERLVSECPGCSDPCLIWAPITLAGKYRARSGDSFEVLYFPLSCF